MATNNTYTTPLKDFYDDNLFITYKSGNRNQLTPEAYSYYSALIFDENNRTIWGNGNIYGNLYYDSYHGEVFNDFINNKATGDYSHAEGNSTIASGNYAHTSGFQTRSYNPYEFSSGKYNKTYTHGTYGKTIFSVGVGDSETNRKNSFTIFENGVADFTENVNLAKDLITYGNTYTKGSSYVNGNTYIEGDEFVRGNITIIEGKLNVPDDSLFDRNVTIGRDWYVYQDAYITGATYTRDAYMGPDNISFLDTYTYLNNAYSYTLSYIKDAVTVMSYDQVTKYYIWIGLEEDLPPMAQRHSNMIYIVLEEPPIHNPK